MTIKPDALNPDFARFCKEPREEREAVFTQVAESKQANAVCASRFARETLDALKDQGVGLVNLGGDRFVPAINIAAEAFTKDDAERLKGDDYALGQTFRAKVETRTIAILSSATPQ